MCAVEGSLAAAAARLGISRPAVSKRITNLEALAGKPLFDRQTRGIRLTETGATLVGAARRVLDERDVLLDVLGEVRGDGPSTISGLRALLGHNTTVMRASGLAEARLAETERVLELIMRATATGVVISDPDTSIIHEVNDSFCGIVGRARDEIIGQAANRVGTWLEPSRREALTKQLHRLGELECVDVRIRRPDGGVRLVETTTRFVTIAGRTQVISTMDDVTERRGAEVDRAASHAGYRGLVRVAALLLAGQSVLDSVSSGLPTFREYGGYATAAVWDLDRDRAHVLDGEPPPTELGRVLADAVAAPHDGVLQVGAQARGPGRTFSGLAVALPTTTCLLVVVDGRDSAITEHGADELILRDLALLLATRDGR